MAEDRAENPGTAAEPEPRPGKEGRTLHWHGRDELTRAPERGDDRALHTSFRLLALALALPAFDLFARRLGLLVAPPAAAFEAMVASWLTILGILALLRHQMLEKRAQRMWLERLEFEELIKSSRNDLRVIVESIRAEQARRLADAKFSIALRVCPYAIALQGLDDGVFLEVNPAFERILGYRRGDVIGRSAAEIGLWDDAEREVRLRQLTRRRFVRERLVVWRSRSGAQRVLLLSAGRTRFGEREALLSMARDVTEKVRRLDGLRSKSELLERARSVIVAVDSDGRVRFWNDQAEAALGWPAAEILGERLERILATPGEFAALQSIDRDGAWRGEARLLHKDGRPLPKIGWGTRVEGHGGHSDARLLFFDTMARR